MHNVIDTHIYLGIHVGMIHTYIDMCDICALICGDTCVDNITKYNVTQTIQQLLQ